jgi:Glycosyltransferase family 87
MVTSLVVGRKGESAEAAAGRGWPFRTRLGRLPLPPKRVRLWAVAVAIIGLVPLDTAIENGGGDWPAFWAAGGTAGTPSLLDPNLHAAWQAARGLPDAAFFWLYPPPAAYLWWPFALLPLWLSFIVNAVLMIGLLVLAAALLTRNYAISPEVALLLAFAWTPATAPAVIGQNAALALVLALWAIDALRRDRFLEAGLACGLMMYKPTLALPLLGFLLLRARWRELVVVAVVLAVAYFAGIAATAGDTQWPLTWWNLAQPRLALDLAHNGDKAISVPGVIGRLPGLPGSIPDLVTVAMVLLSLRGLRRAPLAEAGAAACLLALAVGPRVWGYEAGLMLPILAWAVAGGISEPWRTRLVFAGVPLGLFWLVSAFTVVSGVAVVVFAATAIWLWRWRPLGPDPVVRSAPAALEHTSPAPPVAGLAG